jgi:hypothetical protein
MSKGHLHIFAKGDSEQIEPLYITLKGYPSHIKVSYEPEEIPEDEEPMRAFPQELLKELDKATS